jgi:drug/metabolite transporter (DMT)-like permease
MPFDVYIASAYALICTLSSFVIIGIKKEILPGWTTFVTSFISMVIWSMAIRKSKLPAVELSALFDVVGALAYFIGFALCGERITPIQWTGISMLVFSLYLINK